MVWVQPGRRRLYSDFVFEKILEHEVRKGPKHIVCFGVLNLHFASL